jgi:hypothetical protein
MQVRVNISCSPSYIIVSAEHGQQGLRTSEMNSVSGAVIYIYVTAKR